MKFLFFFVIFVCIFTKNIYAQFEEHLLKGKYYDGRFLVYASDYKLAEDVGAKVPYIYQKVIEDIGYVGAYKTKYQILIWKDSTGFIKFLKDLKIDIPESSAAVAIYEFKGLPTIACYWVDNLLRKNLPHEFTHLVLAEVLEVSPTAIPLWLNEGLATYEGGLTLQYVNASLKKSIKEGSYIKLEELLALKDYPQDSLKLKLFYSEAQSFVSFLIHKSVRKDIFFSFMRGYIVKEYSFQKAYLYSYSESITIDKLQQEWFEYISQLS